MDIRILKELRTELVIKRVKRYTIECGFHYRLSFNGRLNKMCFTNKVYYSNDGSPYGCIVDRPYNGGIAFTFIDFFYKEALIQRDINLVNSYSFKVLKYKRELDRIKKNYKGIERIKRLLKRIFITEL